MVTATRPIGFVGSTCAVAVLLTAVLTAACGRTTQQEKPAGDDAAAVSADTRTPAPSAALPEVSDRAAVLKAARLSVNALGQVRNECDEWVAPQLLPVDLGSAVGPSMLLVISNGPKVPSCYGDGPGLTLFRRTSSRWTQIYSSRGGLLAVLKEQHNGAPDLVFAGPGLSHPAYEWSGMDYAPTKRTVADDRLANVTILP